MLADDFFDDFSGVIDLPTGYEWADLPGVVPAGIQLGNGAAQRLLGGDCSCCLTVKVENLLLLS